MLLEIIFLKISTTLVHPISSSLLHMLTTVKTCSSSRLLSDPAGDVLLMMSRCMDANQVMCAGLEKTNGIESQKYAFFKLKLSLGYAQQQYAYKMLWNA